MTSPSNAAFESELRRIADAAYERPSPPDNPMLRLVRGELPIEEARRFWHARWERVLLLNEIILPRLLEGCPDLDARVLLWTCVYPEYGKGSLRDAHPTLNRRFLEALGVPQAELPLRLDRAKPSMARQIAEIEGQSWLEQLSRFLGRETVGPKVFPIVAEALEQSYGLRGADLEFFAVHSAQDQHDADAIFQLVARYAQGEQLQEIARRGVLGYYEGERNYCCRLAPIHHVYSRTDHGSSSHAAQTYGNGDSHA